MRFELWAQLGENIRHERHGNRREEQSNQRGESRDGRAQTSTTGQETGEEGENLEEEGDKDEDPAESPHVEELGRRGVVAVATDELVRSVAGIRAPSTTKGGRGTSLAAVPVTFAAKVEVGPLSNVASASDTACVGAQEVGLLERRRVGDARQDNEEEEEDGDGRQDNADETEGGVW